MFIFNFRCEMEIPNPYLCRYHFLGRSLSALPMGELFNPDNQVHWSSLPEILVRKLNGDADRIRQYICSPHQARWEECSSRIFFLLLFKQAYYN